MIELLTQLRTHMERIVRLLDYAGITILMTFTPPELIMPFVGFLVNRGELQLSYAILAATLGSIIGQTVLYAVARRVGEHRVRDFIRRRGRYVLLRERDLERSLVLFDRYDSLLLVFGRFVPSLRSLVALPAGFARMRFLRFVLLTAFANFVWITFLVLLGRSLGRNWERLLEGLAVYERAVWIVLILIIGAFVLLRIPRRRTEDSPE
jgi:membrane protein DedA with SNARE-associated domain